MEKKITELERLQIDYAALETQLAQSKAEVMDLKHKNRILMLFVKYGLSFEDTIDQVGNIVEKNKDKEE